MGSLLFNSMGEPQLLLILEELDMEPELVLSWGENCTGVKNIHRSMAKMSLLLVTLRTSLRLAACWIPAAKLLRRLSIVSTLRGASRGRSSLVVKGKAVGGGGVDSDREFNPLERMSSGCRKVGLAVGLSVAMLELGDSDTDPKLFL